MADIQVRNPMVPNIGMYQARKNLAAIITASQTTKMTTRILGS